MTPDGFRDLVLQLPEVMEWVHRGWPDFHVGGRVFAALGWPSDAYGMVVLKAEQKAVLIAEKPAVFQSMVGRMGEAGRTQIYLAKVDELTLWPVLWMAWQGKASQELLVRHARLLVA